MLICLDMLASILLSSHYDLFEQNNLVAKFYASKNSNRKMPSEFSSVCVCVFVCVCINISLGQVGEILLQTFG